MDRHFGKFWLNLGWFEGEDFTLAKFSLFEIHSSSYWPHNLWVIFSIQIAKFYVGIGFDSDD